MLSIRCHKSLHQVYFGEGTTSNTASLAAGYRSRGSCPAHVAMRFLSTSAAWAELPQCAGEARPGACQLQRRGSPAMRGAYADMASLVNP